MEKTGIAKKLGIAATVVSLLGGSLAIWEKVKPEEVPMDCSGMWVLTDTIDHSTDSDYVQNTHEYRITVNQQGAVMEGRGM